MADSHAERFYDALHRIARYYQFRDRDDLTCHGISPTQCYAMFELAHRGRVSMRDLAAAVGLEASSMTRSIDGLFERGLVTRLEDPDDRRRCLIELTKPGKTLVSKIRADCVRGERDILERFDRGSRKDIIRALEVIADDLEARRAR